MTKILQFVKIISLILLVAFCLRVSCQEEPRNNSVLNALYNELFTGYNANLPPLKDIGTAVNVSANFIIYELIKVSEVQNVIVLAGSVEFYWKDEYLLWNAEEFRGVEELLVPSTMIWTPNFGLYNSSGSNGVLPVNGEVELKNDGSVELALPFYFNVLCTIEVRYFPWDRQICKFQFGNMHRYVEDVVIDVKTNEIGLEEATTNQEWALIRASVSQKESIVPDKPGRMYNFLEIEIEMERKPLFFIYTLIIPSFIIALIALIACFSPNNSKGERQEKFKIGLSSFTSLLVLQLNIVNRLPRSADTVPLIGSL